MLGHDIRRGNWEETPFVCLIDNIKDGTCLFSHELVFLAGIQKFLRCYEDEKGGERKEEEEERGRRGGGAGGRELSREGKRERAMGEFEEFFPPFFF